jgi:hypothetical protein
MEDVIAMGSTMERGPWTTKKGGRLSFFASAISVLFVIFAIVLPLDHASQVTTTTTTTPIERGTPTLISATEDETEGKPSAPTRGKFVGNTLNAKVLYQAYKEVETEYHTKAFRRAAQWKVLARRDDVEVSMMEHASDPNCPYVKMVATIPAPVQECWSWLSLDNWPTNMPKMDPFYEGFEIRGDFTYKGVNMILARKRTRRILAFGKRDMVIISVSDKPLSDGTWVSGSVSVQTPIIPRQQGYTRAFQDSMAFYKPLDNNTKTRLTIVCRIDLNDSSEDGAGGWIPMWVYVKTVGAAGLRSVTSMRDIITKEHQAREDAARAISQMKTPQFWKGSREVDQNSIPSVATSNAESEIGRARPRWKLPWVQPVQTPPPVPTTNEEPLRNRIPLLFWKQ